MKAATAPWLLLAVTGLIGLLFVQGLRSKKAPHPATPARHQEADYQGSGACRSCHPQEYDSWNDTFHRSMTRQPNHIDWNGTTAPDWPVELELYGRRTRLTQNPDGTILAQGPDLHFVGARLPALARTEGASSEWKRRKGEEIFRAAPEVQRELVLVTGSHHYLAFWLEGGAEAELRQLPFVFLLREKSWVARESAFLQPPDALPHVARWNANCVQCHSVAGRPRQSEGHLPNGEFWQKYETDVSELGIACEACHGPGQAHISHFQNPLARLASERAREEERESPAPQAAAMFNPAHTRDSEACGQCHSYFVPQDPESWWESGFSQNYEAGQPLEESRVVLRAEHFDSPNSALMNSVAARRESLFWADGSMIIGGREFNGLLESPCFERGQNDSKLTCTSCHSMHSGTQAGQLKRDDSSTQSSDEMCTQCHESIAPTHSRHARTSPGSRCVSCHMPRTSYALLQATRSHSVSSPQADQVSPPNACVLCHLNESQTWVSARLNEFAAGTPFNSAPSASRHEQAPSWAAQQATSGNAVTRALFAHALGSEESILASGPQMSRLLLPRLKQDPYAAVRLIAERSWEQLETMSEAQLPAPQEDASPGITGQQFNQWLAERDTTPIVISE